MAAGGLVLFAAAPGEQQVIVIVFVISFYVCLCMWLAYGGDKSPMIHAIFQFAVVVSGYDLDDVDRYVIVA